AGEGRGAGEGPGRTHEGPRHRGRPTVPRDCRVQTVIVARVREPVGQHGDVRGDQRPAGPNDDDTGMAAERGGREGGRWPARPGGHERKDDTARAGFAAGGRRGPLEAPPAQRRAEGPGPGARGRGRARAHTAGVRAPAAHRSEPRRDDAADVRRAAAAAGLREGARATVEGAATAIGNRPAVRACGGTCGGGAAAADVRRSAAAAGLREGARATVESAAAAIGKHPAVRARGGTCGGGAEAADPRRAAAAAGLREGARAAVEGAAAAIGKHPAVRARGGTCGGGAARAERLLASLDAYPAAAALIGPTRLAVRYAGTRACGTPPDDDEG